MMCEHLAQWKRKTASPWLRAAPPQTLQRALKDLDQAFQNFFDGRASYPTFKKKGRGDSFRYPQLGQIELDEANSGLLLPKLGWVRYRNSRAVAGALRNVTVSSTGDKWFASLQTHTAPARSQDQVQPELEESEGTCDTASHHHCQCPPRLPASNDIDPQQKPHAGRHRRSSGQEHERVVRGQA